MNTNLMHAVLLCAFATQLVSCATPPPPESEWNKLGIWKRVSDDPATYIPAGYASTSPRGVDDGIWFTDKGDGKKVFVPSSGTRKYSRGVLLGEAAKVTGRLRPTAMENGFKYGVALPVGASLAVAGAAVMAMGGG